jgi:hypothetical protein
VNQAEWLASNTTIQLLDYLGEQASDRKLRLFACAACRRIWHLLWDERSRTAVEVAERYADGLATADELLLARTRSRAAQAEAVREIAEGRWRFPTVAQTAAEVSETARQAATRAAAMAADADLVREVFGNPFRPVAIDQFWLRWNDATIEKIARVIYEERRFEDLPILADALEDAGCTNADILSHCARPGGHARGCWVVDLLLGKK